MELRRLQLTCVKLPSSQKDGPERSPWGHRASGGKGRLELGGWLACPLGKNAPRQGVWG